MGLFTRKRRPKLYSCGSKRKEATNGDALLVFVERLTSLKAQREVTPSFSRGIGQRGVGSSQEPPHIADSECFLRLALYHCLNSRSAEKDKQGSSGRRERSLLHFRIHPTQGRLHLIGLKLRHSVQQPSLTSVRAVAMEF